jgi:hypothetical protein
MKRQNAYRLWAITSLLLAPALPLLAADDTLGVKLEEPAKPTKNRFGMSYRMGFNVEANFKNIGKVRTPGAGGGPGAATGGQADRFYDDGYNRVDVSGNTDNLTWFWGYKNAGQIQGDTLVMHSTSARAARPDDFTDDPQHGFELTYNREIGHIGKSKSTWGFEGGFGWMNIDIKDDRRLFGGTRTISDAFDLGGVNPNVPPQSSEYPGHAGTFEGPVPGQPGEFPLIGSVPTRTITINPNGSVTTGARVFEGNLFSVRVGPYVDIPIAEKWTISFSAGAVAAVVDGEFEFDQQTTVGGSSTRQSGDGRNSEVLFGGYASASIRYAINERWGVFVSGQYMGLADCYTASARGQEIELDFTKTVFVSAGVSFSF